MHSEAGKPAVPRWLGWTTGVIVAAGGLGNVALAGAHLVQVVRRALAGRGFAGAEVFDYHFHFFSLVLLGLVIVIPGLVCIGMARRLVRGRRAGWRPAWWSSVILLAVNAALVPIQGFAPLLAMLGAANVAVLGLAWPRYRRAV